MKHIYTLFFQYEWNDRPMQSAFLFTTMKRAAAYGEKWYRINPDCLSYRIESMMLNPINSETKYFAL